MTFGSVFGRNIAALIHIGGVVMMSLKEMKRVTQDSACKVCNPESGCEGCDVHRKAVEHEKRLIATHSFVELEEVFHCQCDGHGDGCHECAGR